MVFEILIALRQFKAKKSKTLKLVTWLAVCGIALGIVALVGGVALTSGFEKAFQDKLTGLTSHIMVREYGFGFDGHQDVAVSLSEIESVKGVSPVTQHFALAVGQQGSAGVMVRGIEPNAAKSALNISNWMLDGELGVLGQTHANGFEHVILGKQLALNLGVKMGNSITVLVSGEQASEDVFAGSEDTPGEFTLIVGGIFEAGFGEFDSKVVYLRLDVAQHMFGMGDAINALEIRVADPLATAQVVAKIEASLSTRKSSFQILDWRQMNRNIFSSLAYQKLAIVVVMLVMVFLAACNAACLLMMMINERVREIAILRAIGLSRIAVMKIFLIQSVGIGGGGTLIGLLIATVFLLNIFPNGIPVDPEVYAVDRIPLVISSWEIFYVGFGSLIVTIFASFLPAWNAAAMKPVDGLRERNQ